MRRISSASETLAAHVAWDSFVADLLSASKKTSTEWIRSFDGGTVRLSPTWRMEKISFVPSCESGGTEEVSVFFDELGQVSRISRKLSDSKSFDNGVRRWPSRKSLVSEVSFVQDFDAEGRPTKPQNPHRVGQMELHVHTKSFVGGSNHETANSLLEYDFEGFQIIPAGERIGDMTSHFPGTDRIKIVEVFVDSQKERSESAGRGESGTLEGSDSEALVKASEAKLNYRVLIDDARITVLMGEAYVASFAHERAFWLAEIRAFLERSGSGSERSVETVADKVANIMDSQNA